MESVHPKARPYTPCDWMLATFPIGLCSLSFPYTYESADNNLSRCRCLVLKNISVESWLSVRSHMILLTIAVQQIFSIIQYAGDDNLHLIGLSSPAIHLHLI